MSRSSRSSANDSLIVRALLDAAPSLHRPIDVLSVLRALPGTGSGALDAEAATLLAEAVTLAADPLTEGQPPDWQWNLAASVQMLERIAAAERVALTDALEVIRLNLVAHRWHLDHRGVDRLAVIRWRFVDLVGRQVAGMEPTTWERQLLDRPVGPVAPATVGQPARSRRAVLDVADGAVVPAHVVSRHVRLGTESAGHRPAVHALNDDANRTACGRPVLADAETTDDDLTCCNCRRRARTIVALGPPG